MDWFEALGAKKPTGGEKPPVTEEPTMPEGGSGIKGKADPAVQEAAEPITSSESPAEASVPLVEEPSEADLPRKRKNDEAGELSDISESEQEESILTREQRAENAKRRRERERRELERQIRQEEQARAEESLNSFIAGLGLTDGQGRPVTNREEFEAFRSQRDKSLIDEELGRLGVDRSVIDAVINSHPAVAEAKRAAEAARDAERRGLDAAAQARAQEQLTEIQKLDPSVKTMEDLRAHESFERVYAFTQSGLSIADAFKAANLDAIRERDRRSAAQAALNAAASKGHMTPHEGGSGELSEPIPEGIRRSYRELYGDISEEDIRKKYEKILKAKKG